MNALVLIVHVAILVIWAASASPVAKEASEQVQYEIVQLPLDNEEQPEHLKLVKRSMTREQSSPLMDMERISKRSLTRDSALPWGGIEKISKRSIENFEEMMDEDTLMRQRRNVFLPNFARRRQRRSLEELDNFQNDVLEANDVYNREKRYVFLPSFARRRSGRSIAVTSPSDGDSDDGLNREKRSVFLPGFAKRRHRRAAAEEDMETAESAVFLPGFSRRGFRRP